MAKQAVVTPGKPGIVTRVTGFYHEVKNEMTKVAWPTREDIKSSTTVVLFVLAIIGVMVFAFDAVFQFVVLQLLDHLG